MNYRRRTQAPIDATGYDEFSIGMIGNVDSGKSTTTSVLTNNILDDGKGSARASVFIHPHEAASGNTSDVSYQYVKDDTTHRIYTYVDLAGHESYLRTTISGLVVSNPDIAIVCISDKLTNITLEHISLAFSLKIPMIFVFTKIDMIPNEITSQLIKRTKSKMRKIKSKIYEMRTVDDFKILTKDNRIVPYLKLSNKTGEGIDLIKLLIAHYPKRSRTTKSGFTIENIYNVIGYGTVVSGIAGSDIKINDMLYIEHPDLDNSTVVIKTIENDYRHRLNELSTGIKGCLCLRIHRSLRKYLKRGVVLKHVADPVTLCNTFLADVQIFHSSTSIQVGYEAYINCGLVKGTVRFISITKLDRSGNEEKSDSKSITVRSGDKARIRMQFIRGSYNVSVGEKIIFREDKTKGIGDIISIS